MNQRDLQRQAVGVGTDGGSTAPDPLTMHNDGWERVEKTGTAIERCSLEISGGQCARPM